jgi:hypothetical protein
MPRFPRQLGENTSSNASGNGSYLWWAILAAEQRHDLCRQYKEDGKNYKSSQNKVKIILKEIMRKLRKSRHDLQAWNLRNCRKTRVVIMNKNTPERVLAYFQRPSRPKGLRTAEK